MGRIREGELRRSAAALGVAQVIVLGLPDGRLQEHRDVLERALVHIMEQVHPQVVITFDPRETPTHPDHVAVGEATTAAFCQVFRGANDAPARLYYVLTPGARSPHRPHVVVDVADYLAHQLRAMRCYQSQRACWESLLAHVGEKGLKRQRFHLAWPRDAARDRRREGSDLFAELEGGASCGLLS